MRSIRPKENMVVNHRLTQIGFSFRAEKHGNRLAVFQCQCGNIVIKNLNHVMRGDTKSCGCLHVETNRSRFVRHGQATAGQHSGAYSAWTAMRRRCKVNPYYVRRGIVVCERWMTFENFFADMGEKPAGLTLDRIDNDGNYEPGNCQWATVMEQQCNKSNNRLIKANGKEMCLSEWARETGIKRDTLKRRLNDGWPGEKIINTPVRQR